MVKQAYFIFYVRDQDASTLFYTRVLSRRPRLHVAGMTEFSLTDQAVLGLMPETGIKRLLGSVLPDPGSAEGIPRAELYLLVDDPLTYHERALAEGGTELSAPASRSWGHEVAYSMDPDGHVLAFARAI